MVWVQLRGCSQKCLHLIAAYCPVYNPRDSGSAYCQQLNYLHSQDNFRDPRDVFWADLSTLLAEAYDNDEVIVLGMDANRLVYSESTKISTLNSECRKRYALLIPT
jgi:hypothetical protein